MRAGGPGQGGASEEREEREEPPPRDLGSDAVGAGTRGSPSSGNYPGPMAYAGIGMLNAVCLLGGGALGWLLDRATGMLPLFLLLGLLVGAGLGVIGTRAELRRYR